MVVSRHGRIPLYAQIRQEIEQDILNGKFKPGDKLPSEEDIAIMYGVSRMTARRAIDQLVSKNRLRRVQGQGTYVVEQATPSQTVGMTRWSFERIEPREGMTWKVLRVEELLPSMRVANALRTILGEKVIQITGLLYLDNTLAGYYIDHIPKLLVSSMEDLASNDVSLPSLLSQQYNLEFGKVVEHIRAIPADEDAIEMLGVEPGSALLEVTDLIYLRSRIPAILSNTVYRCDRYVYKGLLHPL
ncbi:MAG: GntR family transcriptional regulator [Gammaproteobacteria bacterium]|nr:GntR family transcriptional regulator [Gammaproteobacteria bacterium]